MQPALADTMRGVSMIESMDLDGDGGVEDLGSSWSTPSVNLRASQRIEGEHG